MQGICLMFAGIEKPELFGPSEWVIIHLKTPHLLISHGCVLVPEQVQKGAEEGWTDREACVQR